MRRGGIGNRSRRRRKPPGCSQSRRSRFARCHQHLDVHRLHEEGANGCRRNVTLASFFDGHLHRRASMIGLMTTDSGRSVKSVAPFGGRVPRFGTNPICIAMPSNLDGPFFLDISTAAAAGGKLSVVAARGEQVPAGWVIDAEGNSSTSPAGGERRRCATATGRN